MNEILKKTVVIVTIALSMTNTGFAQYFKTRKQVKNLWGYWKMNQNPRCTMCISKDSVIIFYDNKKDSRFKFKLMDSVLFSGIGMIKADKGEKLFVLFFDDGVPYEVDHLANDKNEIDLMNAVNGQTVVYERVKGKCR